MNTHTAMLCITACAIFITAATTGEVVRPLLLLVALAYAAGRAHDPKEDE